MYSYDPSQDSFPGPGFPGTQEPEGAPLAGLPDAIASVLNSAQDQYVYTPTSGPGSPIVAVPRRFPPFFDYVLGLFRRR